MSKFKKNWSLIEVPVILMVAWTIISLSVILEQVVGVIGANIINWVITIAIFGYVGYISIKNKKTVGFGAKLGAIAGVITGFIGAIITIIWFYILPGRFGNVIVQMMGAGMAEEAARSMLQVGLLFGIITGPIVSAILGAIIAVLSALIFSKVFKIDKKANAKKSKPIRAKKTKKKK